MTVTETPSSAPPETTSDRDPADDGTHRELRGLPAVLGTGDHKTVGRVWIGASGLFLLLIAVAGVLLSVERITVDELEVLGNDHVLQFFSLYRVGITFLVVLPLFIGLATAIVPLQVGASTIAFPRAAAAALWTWGGGAVLLLLSYAIDGGVAATESLEPDAIALGLLGLGLVIAGLLLASVCVVTTVIALRPRHMSLLQVPPFAWSMLVAGVVWLLSLPVLMGGLLLAYLDLRYGQVLFGQPAELFSRLEWAFAQPQVYAMAIPVLGVVAEIVPVSAAAVQRHRGTVWAGIGGFGILAFGAWAQPRYYPDLLTEALYMGMAFAIGLPVLLVFGGMADSARHNRPKLHPAFLLSMLGLLLLLVAVGAGAAAVVEPFHLLGTTWVVGQMNFVFTASLVAAVAAICWWAPKIWGRHVPSVLAIAAGLLVAGGGVVLAAAECVAGMLDEPANSFEGFDPRDGVDTFNLIAAIGSIVLAVGALVAVLALLRVIAGRRPAADAADPWGGQTLEWSAPSPPPTGNFPEPVPEVTSATPLVAAEDEA
jgi:heme/copper-type cytochrome/quinol oxidase subunit 1